MVEHTRTLDFKVAFAIGLGTMIAAGIFSLSGTAVYEIGSSAVIAFVIAAIVAGITAAAYSEFASIYSENGGGYLFSSRTFENEYLLYAIGAMLFLGYTGTTAFYLATMDEWVFEFVLPESVGVPVLGTLHPHALPHGTAGVLTAVLLGSLNARGTEESGTFQLLVTGAKVAILFAFIGGAFAFAGPTEAVGTFSNDFSSDAVGIVSISALAFITFFGFSAIAASAGEIIEPRKTVPRAIAASIVTVTILYTFVIIAMVNTPQNLPGTTLTRAEALQQGETAMGVIASAFLGPIGQTLIVAGAIFSMISASNASILAASGIGSLMGRQGQAPRPFSRIHAQFGTPFWSVTGATATIVALIVIFIGLFPAEGGVLSVDLTLPLPVVGDTTLTDLGLESLTGFATLNLLLPLSVVNVALVYSRRRFPDIERGFRVPGVPVVPAVGVVANLALIYNLPFKGVVTGSLAIVTLIVAYLIWGGAPDVSDLVSEVVAPEPQPTDSGDGDERFTVLVPIARPGRAVRYVRLAGAIGRFHDDDPVVEVLTITQIPDQTPSEMDAIQQTARDRVQRIEDELADAEVDVEYTVAGHICRDISFDILQTARDDRPDGIVMGYPETHHEVAETVELKAPCDVYFASGFDDAGPDLSTITIGAGGGPHHSGLLPIVERMATAGTEIHLVTVSPGEGGSPERPEETLSQLSTVSELQIHNVSAPSVAEGLVRVAEEHGGVLFVGATRTRRLRRWVFGSTPDRVIELAESAGVPVVVFATSRGVSGPIEDYTYPVVRRVRRFFSASKPARADPTESETGSEH